MSKKVDKPYNWNDYFWKKQQLINQAFCYYCGIDLDIYNISIDHKNPRSKGGLDINSNKVLCCKKCNNDKANMDFEYFLLKRCGFH